MLIIYTGNGKGKTSATVGQAMRAIGQDMRVAFGQFMKRDNLAGEQVIVKKLLEENFYCEGLGFLTREEDKPEHRKAALALLHWASEQARRVDMLLLDETLYAYSYELITQDELQKIIDLTRKENTHLVLSGRNAPDWIISQAELVTEMKEVKHPYKEGIAASRGIEF